MQTCSQCSSENPAENRYCGVCGLSLTARSPASLVATQVHRTSPSSLSESSEDERFLPGTLLGDRFRIVSLLGSGGMGEVYRATDLKLGQPVALKFLPAATAEDPAALARFHNEVRIARQIAHPNVCRVYDIGEVESLAYISMEYVDGEDLHSLLRRIGRLPSDKAVEIAQRLCAGLAAAHDRGVLHRDLKPANILIDGRGRVRIADFGLAGVAEELHAGDSRSGTPGYMAPEQLAGKEVSVRSDIYSLGLVLYEMFTGKRPFEAETRAQLLELEEHGEPPPPRSIVKDLDPAVDRVILRCLAADPRDRPASALSVAAGLPGGDPLAAALAAGETPSPEMVAQSSAKAGLSPRRAALVLGAVALTFGLFTLVNQKINLLSKIPLDNSPEVLAAKAREIAERLGYPGRTEASAYGFERDGEYLEWLFRNHSADTLKLLASGRPPAMVFWYRGSPVPLIPQSMNSPSRVTLRDPALHVSGMTEAVLDPQGRLLAWTAVPQQQEPSADAVKPDWTLLFAAAGLDSSRFQPAEPRWTPPVFADSRAAWTGEFPGAPGIPLRIEAAAARGKPVHFELIGDWHAQYREQEARPTVGTQVYLVLTLVSLIGSIPFARYNLRTGRGDRRGALRLAGFATSVSLFSWVLSGSHVWAVEEGALFLGAVMKAVFAGAALALMYVSFEPFVRGRWPQMLVSWTRLLGGRWFDPLIGRRLLFGVLIGLLLSSIEALGELAYTFTGGIPILARTHVVTLLGPRWIAGEFLVALVEGTTKALGTLFLLFLLRAAVRNGWLAAAILIVTLASLNAFDAGNIFIGWAVSLVFFTVWMATLMRAGLLALCTAYVVVSLTEVFPLTLDVSAWYAGYGLFPAAVMLGLALFGFRTAVGSEKKPWTA
ncbi:MAG: protein kinase [Acidobacteriota bacterium]|nr:protein kinase [Acidobacteriota bacterium]